MLHAGGEIYRISTLPLLSHLDQEKPCYSAKYNSNSSASLSMREIGDVAGVALMKFTYLTINFSVLSPALTT